MILPDAARIAKFMASGTALDGLSKTLIKG